MNLKKTGLLFLMTLTMAMNAQNKVSDLQSKAKAEHKNIVIYFAGSDWCIPCHQFRESFLKSEKVAPILDGQFVYYLADFPQRIKLATAVEAMNDELAEVLNPEGLFPKLVIADENLKIKAVILKTMSYDEAFKILSENK